MNKLIALLCLLCVFLVSTFPAQSQQQTAEIIYTSDYFNSSVDAFGIRVDGSQNRAITNVLGDLQTRWVDGVACSPDGRYLIYHAAAFYRIDRDGSNRLLLRRGSPHTFALDWSPDNSSLVFDGYGYLSDDQSSEIYTMNLDGSNLQRLTNNAYKDGAPSWSANSQQIVFSYVENTTSGIAVMDRNGSNVRRITSTATSVGYDREPDWSPDGQWITFVAKRGNTSNIFLIRPDGTGLTQLTHTTGQETSPRWSPDGSLISFTSDRDNGNWNIYVMNADGSNPRRVTSDTRGALDFNQCWSILPSASTPTPNPPATATALKPPKELDYSPDGTLIAGVADGLFRIWDATSGNLVHDFTELNQTRVSDASWKPDSKRIVTASDDQFVRVWNVSDTGYSLGQLIHQFQPLDIDQLQFVTSVEWSPDGTIIATGGTNGGRFSLWDATTYSLTAHFYLDFVDQFKWHPTPGIKRVIASSYDTSPSQFDLSGSTTQFNPIGRAALAMAFDWSPDGSKVAIGYYDGVVGIWDANAGNQLVLMADTDTSAITQVSWSPDGARLAAANGVVRVWDSQTGDLIGTVPGTSYAVDFNRDGTQLAIAAETGTIQIASAPLLPTSSATPPFAGEATPTPESGG